MITSLIGFLGSGAFGSIIGSFFAWLNRKEERLAQAEKFKNEQAILALQNQQALALADKAQALTREVGEQAVYKAEANAFTESQKAVTYKSPIMEVIMGCIRPLITLWMLGVSTWLAVNISTLVGGLGSLDKPALLTLYVNIIDQIFFLTNLAVSWWFGARGNSQRGFSKAKS